MDNDTAQTPQAFSEGIAFFEKLLQLRPGDLAALLYLVLAHDLAGQTEQRNRHIPALAAALLRHRDADQAERVLALLPEERLADPALQLLLKRAEVIRGLEAYRQQAQRQTEGTSAPGGAPASQANFTPNPAQVGPQLGSETLAEQCVRHELQCVDWLVEHRLIQEAMADEVRKRLVTLREAGHQETISALRLIEEVDGTQLESCLVGLIQHFEVPPVPVERFKAEGEALEAMGEAEVRVRGVLPFATMAGNLLVATLNPVSSEGLEALAARLARPCRFYLMRPSAFRAACEKRYAKEA